jgi:hypothetical protein
MSGLDRSGGKRVANRIQISCETIGRIRVPNPAVTTLANASPGEKAYPQPGAIVFRKSGRDQMMLLKRGARHG